MDLSVLIVSFNTRELTLACLESVFAQTRDLAFEVIVVDNASADGSAEAIAVRFPQVRLIRAGKNLGFARANNVGALAARGEWVLLLNPDTVVLHQGIGRAMTFARARGDRSIIGGRTYFGDGRLNYNSCHGAPTPWSLLCLGLGLASIFRRSRLFNPEGLGGWRRDCVREVDVVTGCFLLVPRSLWNHLGGFDESFFMYGEDTDLCARARQVGARCWVCPEATLIHYGGASEKVRADKMVRLFAAKAQLFRKHWRPGWVGFGVGMLSLWAFTRMLACGVIARVRPDRRGTFHEWRELWMRRREFSSLPPLSPPPQRAKKTKNVVEFPVAAR